jgi:hypothetical protein
MVESKRIQVSNIGYGLCLCINWILILSETCENVFSCPSKPGFLWATIFNLEARCYWSKDEFALWFSRSIIIYRETQKYFESLHSCDLNFLSKPYRNILTKWVIDIESKKLFWPVLTIYLWIRILNNLINSKFTNEMVWFLDFDFFRFDNRLKINDM